MLAHNTRVVKTMQNSYLSNSKDIMLKNYLVKLSHTYQISEKAHHGV